MNCKTCQDKSCKECQKKERRRKAAKARRDVYASLGMVRVRGALGGVFYE